MASACALLAACQTTGTPSAETSRSAKIDSALERAARTAAAQGERNQSSSYLEKIYKRNTDDPVAATNYAAALREADYLDRAALVLAPFADDPASPSEAKTEYAAVMLAKGDYERAEKYAQKAVLQDETNGRAYHYLGIALDAQSMHPEAERAFRKALDYWEGDPTSIMNNLALNLAAQEHLTEAIEILYKAQSVSPNKREVERNLRIVTALMESQSGRAPRPMAKPVVDVQIQQPVDEIEEDIVETDGKAPVTEVHVEDAVEEAEQNNNAPVPLTDDLNE